MKKEFAFLLFLSTSVLAAPLPDNTLLTISGGVGSDTNTPCSSGSCFGMEIVLGTSVWKNIFPGTDGGIIIGKNQSSGGQEIDEPGSGGSPTNTTSGQITAAWNFGGNWGTFFTASALSFPDNASLNRFNDADCIKADCIGKTEIKT